MLEHRSSSLQSYLVTAPLDLVVGFDLVPVELRRPAMHALAQLELAFVLMFGYFLFPIVSYTIWHCFLQFGVLAAASGATACQTGSFQARPQAAGRWLAWPATFHAWIAVALALDQFVGWLGAAVAKCCATASHFRA